MDFYADPPGTEVEDGTQFITALGGSSANIAVAITRQGGKAALVTALSDDAVGRYVRNQLAHYGIDARHVRTVAGQCRTSLAVVETRLENCQSVIYRNNAADFEMNGDDIDAVDFSQYGALIATGTCFAAEPSRAASVKSGAGPDTSSACTGSTRETASTAARRSLRDDFFITTPCDSRGLPDTQKKKFRPNRNSMLCVTLLSPRMSESNMWSRTSKLIEMKSTGRMR